MSTCGTSASTSSPTCCCWSSPLILIRSRTAGYTEVPKRELFPDKPVVLGCYMRDYTLRAPVPVDRLRHQWERIPRYLERGLINGFCVLGAYLIDRHPEQAEWIREFIRTH